MLCERCKNLVFIMPNHLFRIVNEPIVIVHGGRVTVTAVSGTVKILQLFYRDRLNALRIMCSIQ